MAGIFTRKAITAILNDEALTPEERTDQLFSLYGRALDDGYITKSAAEAAKNSAIEEAKALAVKDVKLPDVKESAEYKALEQKLHEMQVKQEARLSPDFASVKPKFFDEVYAKLNRDDGAKPIKEQLETIAKDYEEYFIGMETEQPTTKPQFGNETKGEMPKGEGEGSFAKFWGYEKQKG